MPPLIGTIGQAASGLVKGIGGYIQMRKANKLLRGLQYPTEQLPQEYIENKNMAKQLAGEGMPSEQYAQAMRNIQRQQLMALSGARDRRGGLGSLSGIQQGTNDALLNLDTANARQRIQNEQNLMRVNNQVAAQKRDLFNLNTRNKYNRDYGYAMSLKGMGNQNLFGGIDQLLGAGVSRGGYGYGRNNNQGYNQTEYDQFFGGD